MIIKMNIDPNEVKGVVLSAAGLVVTEPSHVHIGGLVSRFTAFIADTVCPCWAKVIAFVNSFTCCFIIGL